jgi:ABC-type tungstate transport system permease subunit
MKLNLSLALALFGASAVSATKSTITMCTTSYDQGSGQTTQIAPAVSSKVTVTVAPVATHTVTVLGAKSTTSTAVISLVKKTVTNNGKNAKEELDADSTADAYSLFFFLFSSQPSRTLGPRRVLHLNS